MELKLYLDHRYGTCKKCLSAIQQPGLDHSFCSGCQSWIAAHYVSEANEQQSAITKTASPISARTKRVEPVAPTKKAAQLTLLGGAR